MKFKIREGFKLFSSPDEAAEFECGNQSIRPRAQGGDVVNFSMAELQTLRRKGLLGKLEPIDAEAIAFFGDTKPIVSRIISHPIDYARPPAQRI